MQIYFTYIYMRKLQFYLVPNNQIRNTFTHVYQCINAQKEGDTT